MQQRVPRVALVRNLDYLSHTAAAWNEQSDSVIVDDVLMMSNVTDVKDLGSGVIGGKECDHLAFRTEGTDWQIWIAQGERPYPCRFTITSKMMAQAPSYTIEVTEWNAGEEVASDDFQLKTGDAKEVQISEFPDLDEVPDLSAKGDAQ